MMDDAGSILLLLTRGPSTYATCPSIHGISEAAVDRTHDIRCRIPDIFGSGHTNARVGAPRTRTPTITHARYARIRYYANSSIRAPDAARENS